MHIPVLNYSLKKCIINRMEILSYIHAYTKYALPFNIAATGELGKQRLLEQSETLEIHSISVQIFLRFYFIFIFPLSGFEEQSYKMLLNC